MRRVILVLALTACDAGRAVQSTRRDPGALVVAEAAGVIGLDPVRVTDSESIEVGELIFEGLVRWKPGTTDITAGLATTWKSVDALTWRVGLPGHRQVYQRTPVHSPPGKLSV